MSFLSSEEIWNGVPAEDQIKIMSGQLPEHTALHVIYRALIAMARQREFDALGMTDWPN